MISKKSSWFERHPFLSLTLFVGVLIIVINFIFGLINEIDLQILQKNILKERENWTPIAWKNETFFNYKGFQCNYIETSENKKVYLKCPKDYEIYQEWYKANGTFNNFTLEIKQIPIIEGKDCRKINKWFDNTNKIQVCKGYEYYVFPNKTRIQCFGYNDKTTCSQCHEISTQKVVPCE